MNEKKLPPVGNWIPITEQEPPEGLPLVCVGTIVKQQHDSESYDYFTAYVSEGEFVCASDIGASVEVGWWMLLPEIPQMG